MKLCKVGDLCEQIRGVSYDKGESSLEPKLGLVPILRAGNITDFGIDYSDLVYVPAERVAAKQYIRRHDVLIAASSGSLDVVGKAAAVKENFAGGFGAFCKVLRPNDYVSPVYFAHFFRTAVYRKRVSALAAGANINNLRNEHIDELEIPLPPLEEQRRIAAILDAADALREKRRQALAKLDGLVRAAFLEMFGDESNTITIGDALRQGIFLLHKDGNHGALYPKPDDFGDVGVPFISAKSISDTGEVIDALTERLSEQKASQLRHGWLQKDDVLLSHNASVGKVGLYRGQYQMALVGTSLTVFRANQSQLHPLYLFHTLRMSSFKHQLESNMAQTTRNQVPITAQRYLQIPLPSFDKQLEFARIAGAISNQSTLQQASIGRLEALFTSLQQRAFRGEL